MEPDFEDALVLLDGLGDGHLHLVAQEVGLLVARLDFRQDLLGVGRLKNGELAVSTIRQWCTEVRIKRLLSYDKQCRGRASFKVKVQLYWLT